MFALATGDWGLMAFPTAQDAESHCEGIDVADGRWLFFADDGSPIEARFDRPDHGEPITVAAGAYTLKRAMAGLWLQERLGQVKTVDGCGLTALPEVVQLLKVNRANRAARGIQRGRP